MQHVVLKGIAYKSASLNKSVHRFRLITQVIRPLLAIPSLPGWRVFAVEETTEPLRLSPLFFRSNSGSNISRRTFSIITGWLSTTFTGEAGSFVAFYVGLPGLVLYLGFSGVRAAYLFVLTRYSSSGSLPPVLRIASAVLARSP